MSCRHSAGDPNCSSSAAYQERARNEAFDRKEKALAERAKKVEAELKANTPDPSDFDITDIEQVGSHLVMKVKFPSCAKCEYEGNKVMVFLNRTLKDVFRWKRIDPHFRAATPAPPSEAPSPAARFPGSNEGWDDAMRYAREKNASVTR